MVRNKKFNITLPNAVVHPASNSGPSKANKRNRRKPSNASMQRASSSLMNTTTNMLSEMTMMNRGVMANEPGSDMSFIRSIRDTNCGMDTNTEGWYFKYLDPAGAVETGRNVGESSKIPDGLLTFSVDAEIRTVDTLPVPMIEDDVSIPGSIPLDGATWSLTVFSYPMFRTAYIAVANRFDKEISPFIASELAFVLNNLLDYRATIDANEWQPFAQIIEDGWFYWIKSLPPTYNLSDPVSGDQRTLTSWRMSYKSLTIEHNAPTLIDQGFWNGGHYALDSSIVQQPTEDTEMVHSYVHSRATVLFNTNVMANARYSVKIPNLPQLATIGGPASLVTNSDNLYFNVLGDNSADSGVPVTWIVPPMTAMYNPFEIEFAVPGDVVTMSSAAAPNGVLLNFTSSNPLSIPFSVSIPSLPVSTVVPLGSEGIAEIYTDNIVDLFENRTSNQIEFPAYNPAQIAANNPKMEQFLMKESNGAYVVHKKMRAPVFKVTPAGSFGPVQFTTPDYSLKRNTNDGSGILDTFDANFSTASVCIRGIAHANVPVIKLYQGWEGVTNLNTPFGQFGHSGLARSDCVMELVDNITVRTTGIYPANDNFLGLIAKFAANALKSLLSSQATPTLLGNLAQGVIDKGISAANNKLSKIGRQSRRR